MTSKEITKALQKATYHKAQKQTLNELFISGIESLQKQLIETESYSSRNMLAVKILDYKKSLKRNEKELSGLDDYIKYLNELKVTKD